MVRTFAKHWMTAALMVGLTACGSTSNTGYRPSEDGGADDAATGVDAPATGDTPSATTDNPATADVPVTRDVPMTTADVGPPSACVSGTHWTRGNSGSALMNPGQACIACHTMRREGPQILGGTAYYQDHEENNCNGFRGTGSTSGARVEATDASGRTFTMAINAAGNFYYNSRTALQFPLHGVAVIGPTGARNEMGAEVPNGDCNACHTQAGTTTVAGGDPAPGRITVPQ